MLLTAGVLAGRSRRAGTLHGRARPDRERGARPRFQKREAQPPGDVAVVAIDDVTFSDLELQWPFPRSLTGGRSTRLAEAGAREIVIDVQFTEKSTRPRGLALYDAIDRAGGAVLATSETDGRGGTKVLGGDENLARSARRPPQRTCPTRPAGSSAASAPRSGACRRSPSSVASAGRAATRSAFERRAAR